MPPSSNSQAISRTTLWTTLVPIPSILAILRMPSPFARSSLIVAATDGLSRASCRFAVPAAAALSRHGKNLRCFLLETGEFADVTALNDLMVKNGKKPDIAGPSEDEE
jgi:hypothetical protein